jgi:hypothetical protein
LLEPLKDENDRIGLEGGSNNGLDSNEDLVLTNMEAKVVVNDARLYP